jgi:hypothetical protein
LKNTALLADKLSKTLAKRFFFKSNRRGVIFTSSAWKYKASYAIDNSVPNDESDKYWNPSGNNNGWLQVDMGSTHEVARVLQNIRFAKADRQTNINIQVTVGNMTTTDPNEELTSRTICALLLKNHH